MYSQHSDEFIKLSPINQMHYIDNMFATDIDPRVVTFYKEIDKYYLKTFRDPELVNYFDNNKRGEQILGYAMSKALKIGRAHV